MYHHPVFTISKSSFHTHRVRPGRNVTTFSSGATLSNSNRCLQFFHNIFHDKLITLLHYLLYFQIPKGTAATRLSCGGNIIRTLLEIHALSRSEEL